MSDNPTTSELDDDEELSLGIYEIFSTDTELERKGFALEYGPSTFVIARSGGANVKYQRCMERLTRPHRSMINAGNFPESQSKRILAQAFAETIILAWSGVTDIIGDPIEFTKENVVKVLIDLPDLFLDLQTESSRIANYNTTTTEEDSKS